MVKLKLRGGVSLSEGELAELAELLPVMHGRLDAIAVEQAHADVDEMLAAGLEEVA